MTAGQSESSRPVAVIAGLDSMQGLQTARILARQGLDVVGVSSQGRHHANHTRACRRVVTARPDQGMAGLLRSLGPELGTRAVLVPATDGAVSAVSRNREVLGEWFDIVLPTNDTVDLLMRKDRFAEFARAHGFPIPLTGLVDSEAELAELSTRMRFPVVIKPPFRTPLWTSHTTEKAFLVKDAAELAALYERISAWSDRFVVQQWVPGGMENLYSCNVYYTRMGQLAVAFVARKLRQWPVDTGQSSLGEECRHDGVLALTRRVFDEAGLVGLGYLEVKEDVRDGALYIIEPNIGRPTGRSAIAEGGGVDLLYTMYCDAAGLPLPSARTQSYQGTKWVHLRRDLQASLVLHGRGELTFVEWVRSLRGRKVYAVFSLRDPLPFLLDLWEALRKVVRRRA